VNIKGVNAGDMQLTPAVLADIYLGKITKWNDPAIVKLNPKLPLSDATINVVHRSDGSGTTFIFTHYLSQVSADWKSKVGENTSVEGSFTPALSAAIRASFHFVILPRKMSARTGPVNLRSPVTPGRLSIGTSPPSTVGKCMSWPGAALSCSSVIGPSDAPKNTVSFVICLMPAPDPSD